jgi:hypothetical protein
MTVLGDKNCHTTFGASDWMHIAIAKSEAPVVGGDRRFGAIVMIPRSTNLRGTVMSVELESDNGIPALNPT